MEPCEKLSALLDAFIDGELPEAEANTVRRHLAECEHCRAYVADAFAMREALEDLGDVQVPEDFTRNVMAAVRSAPPQARRRSFRPVRILAPLAACLAIAAVVGLGPLSSRMTENAAQTAALNTQTAGTALPQERDASDGTQETDASASEAPDFFQSSADSSTATESAQAEGEEAQEETAAQNPPSVQSTMQASPEDSAPYQAGNSSQEKTVSQNGAAVQSEVSPQSSAPASVTGARVDQENTTPPADNALQDDGETYFTQLTLTADQAGTLLDGVEAAQTVRDPDTGAELQRIYHLDRTQFQSLMEQLPDVAWTDSGGGDLAEVTVVLG